MREIYMKPISLTIEGFGSYAEKTKLDFDEDNLQLFLVSGDTGSGKTTIFDALAFALYGQASASGANGKPADSLYSHYDSKDCCVSLKFASGTGDTYTITRRPQRPGKRSAKIQPATAELTLPDKSVLTRISEVNDRIDELVGLTRAQFLQVGMLAQGEFMKFLTAKTSEKRDILRKLFKTNLFKDIQDALSANAAAAGADLQKWWDKICGKCSALSAPESYPEHEEFTELLRKISESGSARVSLIEDLTKSLGRLVSFEVSEKTRIEELVKNAETAYRKASKELQDAQNLDKDFAAAEKARSELAQCEALKEEKEAHNALAQQLRSAYEIKPVCDQAKKAAQALLKTQTDLASEEKRLPDLRRAAEDAASESAVCEKTYNELVAENSALQQKVTQARNQFLEIGQRDARIKKDEAAHAKAVRDKADAQDALAKLEKNVEAWKKELETYRDVTTEGLKRKGEIEDVEGALKAHAQYLEAEKAVAKAEKKALVLGAKSDSALMAYRSAHTRFFASYAGILAKELEDGKPCPVCGSTEHPHPAANSETDELTQDELRDLEKKADDAKVKFETASLDCRGAVRDAENARRNLEDALRTVENIAQSVNLPVAESAGQDTEAFLKSVSDFLNSDILRLRKDALRAGKLEKDIKKSAETTKTLTARIMDSASDISRLEAQIAENKNAVSDLRSKTEYESAREAEDLLEMHNQKTGAAEDARKAASSKKDKAARALTTCEASIMNHKAQLPEREREAADTKKAYEAAMAEHDIDEASWQALTAQYKKEQIRLFESEYEAFQSALNQKRGIAAEAEKKIAGRERPDIAPLHEAEQSALRLQQEALSEKGRITEKAESDQDACSKLAASLEDGREKHDTYFATQNLSEKLSGKKSGQKIPLETFVQRAYFETMLQAANERFRAMTGNQYELHLVDEEKGAQGRGDSGLDLTVYSNATGKERPILTLSGGESFMAALSLALGMADVIEAESSAVSLGMMFIDEGFGTLDDNARRQAVSILQHITEGNKLIGIISHVHELKQEIDDQIEVTKDEHGSHARWVRGDQPG